MPSNVEIKASVSDPAQLVQLAEHLSGSQGTVIVQEDVFFNCPNGRLKLRKLQVVLMVINSLFKNKAKCSSLFPPRLGEINVNVIKCI